MTDTTDLGRARLAILETRSISAPTGYHPFDVHGFGAVLGGPVRDSALGRYHLQAVWTVLFYVPVWLQGVYLASHPIDGLGVEDRRRTILHRRLAYGALEAAYGPAGIWRIVGASGLAWLRAGAWVAMIIGAMLLLAWPFLQWLQQDTSRRPHAPANTHTRQEKGAALAAAPSLRHDV